MTKYFNKGSEIVVIEFTDGSSAFLHRGQSYNSDKERLAIRGGVENLMIEADAPPKQKEKRTKG